MGLLGGAGNELGEALDGHGDTVGAGTDRAADPIDDRTGGKPTEQLGTGGGHVR